MAENSKIEWTDYTWSPWEGCQKVSPGCDHCYAEGMNRWLRKGENWGPDAPRRAYSDEHWEKPLRWNAAAEKAGARPKVFPSVCDPFDNAVPPEWRARFFELIRATPNLTWLLLTKRIGNAVDMLPWAMRGAPGNMVAGSAVWPNVWIGATIVNQEEADRDIPKLLSTPAAVRFLSCEPLLGPVDLSRWLAIAGNPPQRIPRMHNKPLHWVIVGGESGRGARPMNPDWARSLRDQCAAAGLPFLFKQHGEWVPGCGPDGERQVRHSFPGRLIVTRVGKKAAGRLLDGVTHDGFPGKRSA